MSRTQEIVVLVLMAAAFAFGRFSVRGSETVTTEAQIEKQQDVHTVTTTVVTKEAGGAVKVVQTKDRVARTNVEKNVSQVDEKKNVSPITNVSVLGGEDLSSRLPKFIYGVSVSREIIGPVTVGAWGLSNGTLGVSIGLNF